MDNFLAITECKDADIAMIFLNDNQWNLEVRDIYMDLKVSESSSGI